MLLPCLLGGCVERSGSELDLSSATLLSRDKHGDLNKAVFSFEHGHRDEALAGNDWDVEFGNGGDGFNVTMATDDRSRIRDLGWMQWSGLDLATLPHLPAHPEPAREPQAKAFQGHIYMVHTKDENSDLHVLFRVEKLFPGDRAELSWAKVEAPGK